MNGSTAPSKERDVTSRGTVVNVSPYQTATGDQATESIWRKTGFWVGVIGGGLAIVGALGRVLSK